VASSVHQRVALTVLGIVVLSTVTPIATGQAPKQFTRSLPSIPALGASLVEKRNQTPSVLVAGVGERTPAAAAGLSPGDLVLRMGSHAITTMVDVIAALDQVPPGASIDVVIRRNGQEKALRLTPDTTYAAVLLNVGH